MTDEMQTHILAGESLSDAISRHVRYGLVIIRMSGVLSDDPNKDATFHANTCDALGSGWYDLSYLAGWRELRAVVNPLSSDEINSFVFWGSKVPDLGDIRDLKFTIVARDSQGHLPTVLRYLHSTYLRLMEKDPHGQLLPPWFLL